MKTPLSEINSKISKIGFDIHFKSRLPVNIKNFKNCYILADGQLY